MKKQERLLPKIAMGFLLYSCAGSVLFPDVKDYVDKYAYDTVYKPVAGQTYDESLLEIQKATKAKESSKSRLEEAFGEPYLLYWTEREGEPLVVRCADEETDDVMKKVMAGIASLRTSIHWNDYENEYDWYTWKLRRDWTIEDKVKDFWGDIGWTHYGKYMKDRIDGGLVFTITQEMALEDLKKVKMEYFMHFKKPLK